MIGFGTVEKEQNIYHTQVSRICIPKTNLIFFDGRCRMVYYALLFAGLAGTVALFQNLGLRESQGLCIFIPHSWNSRWYACCPNIMIYETKRKRRMNIGI